MKIKLSIILLIGISIFPIHSIAWDEGASIELKGVDSNLYTITKVRNGTVGTFYLSPTVDCSYAMTMYKDSIFNPWTLTCQQTSTSTNDTKNFKWLGEPSTKENDMINEAKFIIEAPKGSSKLTLSIPKAQQHQKLLFSYLPQIYSDQMMFSFVCYDTNGNWTEETLTSITLSFDNTDKYVCYMSPRYTKNRVYLSISHRTQGDERNKMYGSSSMEQAVQVAF